MKTGYNAAEKWYGPRPSLLLLAFFLGSLSGCAPSVLTAGGPAPAKLSADSGCLGLILLAQGSALRIIGRLPGTSPDLKALIGRRVKDSSALSQPIRAGSLVQLQLGDQQSVTLQAGRWSGPAGALGCQGSHLVG
jgi:hypothetical protein